MALGPTCLTLIRLPSRRSLLAARVVDIGLRVRATALAMVLAPSVGRTPLVARRFPLLLRMMRPPVDIDFEDENIRLMPIPFRPSVRTASGLLVLSGMNELIPMLQARLRLGR